MTTAARSTKVVLVDVIDATTTAIRIVGDFDALSVSEAAPVLLRFKSAPPMHLQIDASRAGFVDSTGIAALAMAADTVRRSGGDVTTTASDSARRVIELCGLADLVGYQPV